MNDYTTNDKPRARRNDVGSLYDRSDLKKPVGFFGTVKVGMEIVDIQLIRVSDVPAAESVFERSSSPPDFVIFEHSNPDEMDASEKLRSQLEFEDNIGVAWVRERPEVGKTLDISFDMGVLGRHRAQGLPRDPKDHKGYFRICVSV